MGKWPLEVARMFCYMAFPVGCFHYFNQASNFEEWVIRVRRESLHTETPELRTELKNFIEERRREERLKSIEAMEASDRKFKELQARNASQNAHLN